MGGPLFRGHRTTVPGGSVRPVGMSRDGKRLVATIANPQVGLWTVPIKKEGVSPKRLSRRWASSSWNHPELMLASFLSA